MAAPQAPTVEHISPRVTSEHAGKLRSTREEACNAKKQLEIKEDPTEEDLDAELLLARNASNSKSSLQRSFGFRSKKDVIGVLHGAPTAQK